MKDLITGKDFLASQLPLSTTPLSDSDLVVVYQNGVTAKRTQITTLIRYFTELRNTATPNATVPAHNFTASGTATNIDLVISAKGTGSLIRTTPDNTLTGGNKRGTNAVDFQRIRTAPEQVASGTSAFIGCGVNNTASGAQSAVAGGTSNIAAAINGGVFTGVSNNTGTGAASVVVGGSTNSITSGINGFIGAGTNNISVGNQSVVVGGSSNTLTAGNTNTIVGGSTNTISAGSNAFVGAGSTNSVSGSSGAIVAGSSNSVTGSTTFIGSGSNNIGGGVSSFIGGGTTNTTSANTTVIAGGSTNAASGTSSSIGGGTNNSASGTNSTIPGGAFATTNAIQGQFAYGFSSAILGASQMAITGGRRVTTNATTAAITSNGGAAAVTNQLTLRDNTAYRFRGFVVARNPANGDAKEWRFEGLIKRGTGAASVVFVGTPTVTSAFADAGAATWAVDVVADTTNGALQINITGQAATTINWMGATTSEEVA